MKFSDTKQICVCQICKKKTYYLEKKNHRMNTSGEIFWEKETDSLCSIKRSSNKLPVPWNISKKETNVLAREGLEFIK